MRQDATTYRLGGHTLEHLDGDVGEEDPQHPRGQEDGVPVLIVRVCLEVPAGVVLRRWVNTILTPI